MLQLRRCRHGGCPDAANIFCLINHYQVLEESIAMCQHVGLLNPETWGCMWNGRAS